MCESSHHTPYHVKHENRIAEPGTLPGEPQPAGADYLSDYSPKDKIWDKHKALSDVIARLYADGGDEWEKYAKRVHQCAGFLEFADEVDRSTGEVKPKLRRASFCRVRHCPICQWRRSLVNKARFLSHLPAVLAAHPGSRLLFLTLTIRNCDISELRCSIKAMNKALRRMIQRKTWPALGWVKSIEVTRGQDGSAHPHFHIVLLVPGKYFTGRAYIKQADWTDAWQQALQVDYQPIVDVRAIQRGQESQVAPELLKYATKPADMIGDLDWFLEYSRQTRGMRFVESGGVFRDVLKDDPDEDEMIHTNEDGDEPAEEDAPGRWFKWDRPIKRYRKHKGND